MKTEALLKILALSVISAIPAFFLGRILASLSSNLESVILTLTDPTAIVTLILTLAISAALLSLILSFNLPNSEMVLVALIPTIGFALPLMLFGRRNVAIVSVSAIIFFVATVKLAFATRKNIQNVIKINTWELYPPRIKEFFLLVALLFALNFGFSYASEINSKGFEVPDTLLDKMAIVVIPIIEDQLGQQLEEQFGERFSERLGVEGEEEILKFLKEETDETLKEGEGRQRFGFTPENLNLEEIKITPEGKLDLSDAFDVIKPELKNQIKEFVAPYQKFIAPFFAVLLFFTLHFLGRVAVLSCPLIISLSLFILKATDVVRARKEMVEAERLEL